MNKLNSEDASRMSLTNTHMQYNPDILDDIPARLAQESISHAKQPQAAPSDINDIRQSTEFRGVSFSGYKKTDVRTQLINSMLKGKVEPACYWAAELICAGHFGELWEIIIHYMAKYVHLGNPKLAIYLEMRYESFRNNMIQGIQLSELDMRNDNKIRRLFGEIICTLTLSIKKPSIEVIKINRAEEYDVTQMTEKLKAPSMAYAEPIFQPKDPRELFIALNELGFCLTTDQSNMLTACYWVEWINEFNAICKKRKEPIRCVKRSKYPVENKFQCDVIWLVWDTLLNNVERRNNPLLTKTMNALLRLFCVKYSTAACNKKRYLLYYAVGILTERVNTNVELVTNRELLQTVTDKIDEVYKQIKQNEQAPKTEYLFHGIDKRHALERSLKQMEIVGQIDNSRIT